MGFRPCAGQLLVELLKIFVTCGEEFVRDHCILLLLLFQELARRFSLSFGLDQIKNRDAVAAMHK